MSMELADDGTMDTVLRCTECGDTVRFQYHADNSNMTYGEFVQFCIASEQDPVNGHVCAKDCTHEWDEQPGEPPVDVCFHCGTVRQ